MTDHLQGLSHLPQIETDFSDSCEIQDKKHVQYLESARMNLLFPVELRARAQSKVQLGMELEMTIPRQRHISDTVSGPLALHRKIAFESADSFHIETGSILKFLSGEL
jgi:hypothetical protein